ncbi:MAG: hypothetical protein HQ559_09165, partial [Lentisphaerae bacterium]|nr:hypothetical protein [Lentisphaerota bacterium]
MRASKTTGQALTAFLVCAGICGGAAAASAETLVLRAGSGLDLSQRQGNKTVIPARRVLLVRDAGDSGLANSAALRVDLRDLDHVPPASKIKRAVLRKTGRTVTLPPPRAGSAPFAPVGVWIAQKTARRGKRPAPLAVLEGTGDTTCDLTEALQQKVYENPAQDVALLLEITEDASGAQVVIPESIVLEIEYGPVEAQHRLAAPTRIRVAPEQDRTFEFHWKPGGAVEPLKKVKYGYEFEVYLTDKQFAARRRVYERLKHTFEQWDADSQAREAFEEIETLDDKPEPFSFVEAAEELKKAITAKLPKYVPPADAETVGQTWQEALQAHPMPPEDPGEPEGEAGQWLPMDVRFFVPWNENRVEVDKSFARIDLGKHMPREELSYRFRARVAASNGQVSDWSEAPAVKQRNPGYLAWASHICYKAQQKFGAGLKLSFPFGDAYAMNYDNMPLAVSIAAAKDEYEPFQVLFKHEFDQPAEVALELSPLVGDKGRIETWAM